MYKLLAVGFAAVVMLATIFMSSLYAQNNISPDNSSGGVNNQAQPNPNEGQTVPGNTSTLGDDIGFDWRWLLPLVSIPILFLIWKSTSSEDTDGYYRQDRYLTGAKGGRARRSIDGEEEVV